MRLHYRIVNHAERWKSADMLAAGGSWRGQIPADYTHSPYPLQYYFVLTDAAGRAWMYPGFTSDLSNQPYVVLRRLS